ncbi:MAG: HD domain-containing phosphohydrolase [Pseudomonadota bacterium]
MDSEAKPTLQAVSVSRLRVGMYVAELDRPWRETPFKFQGFEILSSSEIELLDRYCDSVFVDPGFVSTVARSGRRGGDPEPVGTDSTNVIDAQSLRLRSLLGQQDAHDYSEQVSISRERPQAVEAYHYAQEGLAKFDKALRQGKQPEARHVRGLVQPIIQSVARNPDALVWHTCLKKASPEPGGRRVGTAVWIAVLGRHLGLAPPLLLDLTSGGLLLDIGMSRMDRSLMDTTVSFDSRQHLAVRGHVQLGLDLIERIPGVTDAVTMMVAEHHERLDGSGYPHRLTRAQISAQGAMAAVADAFDAMISPRPHSAARSTADAIGELNRMSGEIFASLVVEQFVQALGLFPCGSIVELNTGEIAVVAEQDARHRLRPLLSVVTDAQQEFLPTARKLNLAHFSAEAAARQAVWIVAGHPPGAVGADLHRYFD